MSIYFTVRGGDSFDSLPKPKCVVHAAAAAAVQFSTRPRARYGKIIENAKESCI